MSGSGSHGRNDDHRGLVDFTWDFGDGTVADGETVSHIYHTPGVYRVTLTVTDKDGLSNSGHSNINIVAAPATSTATPTPTATPKPTAAPKPTATPTPTATPKPTAIHKPTAKSKPPKHTPKSKLLPLLTPTPQHQRILLLPNNLDGFTYLE